MSETPKGLNLNFDDHTRVLPYDLLTSYRDITWKDVMAACFSDKSPFNSDEQLELSALRDDDELFFKRMFEMLKNETN